MKGMTVWLKRREVRLAILAPPTEISQKLTDRLVSAGGKAIWNFTPTRVRVPSGLLVRNEQHCSIGLSEIAHYLAK